MKKVILLAVCVSIASAAFGADFTMSFGGGVFYGMINDIKGGNIAASAIESNGDGFGAFFFFDATYVEVTLAYSYSRQKVETARLGFWNSDELNLHAIDISVLGKYPFQLSERWRLFPLLGISYLSFVAWKEGKMEGLAFNVEAPGEANRLGFLGGIGADFLFSNGLFIRGEFLWGIWLTNQYERAFDKAITYISVGNGPRFKLALGYTFR